MLLLLSALSSFFFLLFANYLHSMFCLSDSLVRTHEYFFLFSLNMFFLIKFLLHSIHFTTSMNAYLMKYSGFFLWPCCTVLLHSCLLFSIFCPSLPSSLSVRRRINISLFLRKLAEVGVGGWSGRDSFSAWNCRAARPRLLPIAKRNRIFIFFLQ